MAWSIQRGDTVHEMLGHPFWHPAIEEWLAYVPAKSRTSHARSEIGGSLSRLSGAGLGLGLQPYVVDEWMRCQIPM